MSEERQNKIKASIKTEIIKQVEIIFNSRLLYAHFANTVEPSEARLGEFQATLIACQELLTSILSIPETSEYAFDALSHSLPHFDFIIKNINDRSLPQSTL